MNILDRLQADEAARKRRLEMEDEPVSVLIPGFENGEARRVIMTYREAAMLWYEVGAVLYGADRKALESPAPSPISDDGNELLETA